MKPDCITKPAFCVIGKEGSTADGPGFVQRLWAQANAHFDEVAHLAKRDENGVPLGFWGAMTDRSRTFRPWEDGFSRGLYLAGEILDVTGDCGGYNLHWAWCSGIRAGMAAAKAVTL